MYRVTSQTKIRRHRTRLWLVVLALLFLVIGALVYIFLMHLQTKPVITQAKAKITKVSYQGKLKHYNEADFTIDLPVEWEPVPRPPFTYNSFSWKTVDKADSVQLDVYEDTIPTNFAVNQALIVSGQGNHVELVGTVSDNCVTFTDAATGTGSNAGVSAKWQGVYFLCNRLTTDRHVAGTSSTDGINTVKLTSSNGTPHTFFFKFTDNRYSPDYTIFYNALTSFNLK